MGLRRSGLRAVTAALALCVLVATVAIAATAPGRGAATTKAEELELTAGGSFSPGVAPSPRQTPVRLHISGKIADPAAPRHHPPAIREIQLESAGLEIHTGGIPFCRAGQLQATETRTAERACRSALIGAGTAEAQVAFAEQRPVDLKSRLLVFTGGREGGRTKLFLHTYFSNPISGAIVIPVTVTSLPGSHFGTLAVARVPQITGGSGSIIGFHLTIDRNVRGSHPISATCEDGTVRVYVEGKFEDGRQAATEIVRPCRP